MSVRKRKVQSQGAIVTLAKAGMTIQPEATLLQDAPQGRREFIHIRTQLTKEFHNLYILIVAINHSFPKLPDMEPASLRRPPPPHRRNSDTAASSLVIRNVVVGGRRTSVRLEPMMWEALRDIARRLRGTVNDLVTEIDRTRTASSLTAGIRVYIVDFYRAAALVDGRAPVRAARDLVGAG